MRDTRGSDTKRLYLLDVVRGSAALAVVVAHYQHFFYAGSALPPGWDRTSQPLYALLWPIYHQGGRAVQMFFVLSGFVFFFHYREAIRTGAVDACEFFILRFSRLYPLHAATLITVALGQFASRMIDGQFVVYPCNDLPHFALNILFVMHWLPANNICFSFNAPSWSVSVEIFMYAIFFLAALQLPKSWRGQAFATLAIMATGALIYSLRGFHLIAEPMFCFFGGGLACLVWQRWRAEPRGLILAGSASIAAVALYLFVRGINEIIIGAALYPSVALMLATLQTMHPSAGRRGKILGDISYSTYLLHFPIQLSLLLLYKARVVHIDFASSLALFLFFALVICLSWISYRYFELPVQSALRRRLLTVADGLGISRIVRPTNA